MYPPILRVHLKQDQRGTYLMMLMQCYCMFVFLIFFVCVEVLHLQPSQPRGVMLRVVCLPNHTFTGQA